MAEMWLPLFCVFHVYIVCKPSSGILTLHKVNWLMVKVAWTRSYAKLNSCWTCKSSLNTVVVSPPVLFILHGCSSWHFIVGLYASNIFVFLLYIEWMILNSQECWHIITIILELSIRFHKSLILHLRIFMFTCELIFPPLKDSFFSPLLQYCRQHAEPCHKFSITITIIIFYVYYFIQMSH